MEMEMSIKLASIGGVQKKMNKVNKPRLSGAGVGEE